MLQVIKGEYENGIVTLEEMPVAASKTKALVILLDEIKGSTQENETHKNKLVFGSFRDQINVPSDFDAPLDDLQEYMS